jgi:hypothetical protein
MEATKRVEGESGRPTVWSRLGGFVRRRPITALALAAGASAIGGAEILAAGLAGGAAVLLWQRGRGRGHDLAERMESTVESVMPHFRGDGSEKPIPP